MATANTFVVQNEAQFTNAQHSNNMRTIIACTDFSPNASNAVQYAAAFANAIDAKLVLFHHFIYPVPATDIPMGFPAAYVDEMAEGLSHRLEQAKTDLAKTFPIEIECVVRSWDLSLDLEEVFQTENADLVVMGMQGQSAVFNALVGNISATTIRRGRLPLLVVPRGVAFHPVRKILFPSDDHNLENAGTIKPLLNLALDFDAYIEVLTLFDLQKTPELVPQSGMSDAKNNLDKLLADTRHGYSYENEAAVEHGILYEAARSKADLVAMIPHHHSFWSNLLNQSHTQRVAASIMLPLLVLGENVK